MRLKDSGFLICPKDMRNPHRHTKGSFSKDLWYQLALGPTVTMVGSPASRMRFAAAFT